MVTVLGQLEGLQEYHKQVLNIRYIPLLKSYKQRCMLYALLFHTARFIVTVGSITVPALLSLEQAGHMNWLTWAISLAVTICNGILTLFKIDKKYYMLHTTWNMLESEGWQYTTLAGKYSKPRDGAEANSHINQFQHFCLAIEKLRMRQVEDEYYKSLEVEKEKPADKSQNPQANQSAIVPYSPSIKSLEPQQILSTIVNQIRAATGAAATGIPRTPNNTPKVTVAEGTSTEATASEASATVLDVIEEQNTIVPPE